MYWSFTTGRKVRLRVSKTGYGVSFGPWSARFHVSGFWDEHQHEMVQNRRHQHEREVMMRRFEKQQRYQDLLSTLKGIDQKHWNSYLQYRPPQLESPNVGSLAAFEKSFVKESLKGLGLFDFSGRKAAREKAKVQASSAYAKEIKRTADAHRAEYKAKVNFFNKLVQNDPETVIDVTNSVFNDFEAPARVWGVDGKVMFILIQIPGIEAIPEMKPDVTEAGNISITKMPVSLRNKYYRYLICGTVLDSVKLAFAAAPNMEYVRVVSFRPTPLDAYGRRYNQPIMAYSTSKTRLRGVQWEMFDSEKILMDTQRQVIWKTKRNGEMVPIDPLDYPEIGEVVGLIEQS